MLFQSNSSAQLQNLSFEILMEEIKNVVRAKNEFEYEDKSMLIAFFGIHAL